MVAKRLRAVVLDFDGVIVESNEVKTDAFREIFARFPEHTAAMMDFHGANVALSRYAKFDHLLERLGRSGDAKLREELAAEFSRQTIERIASVTLVEDLDVILERRGMCEWFRGVYGCPPWTKSEAIRDVLRREACAPDEALLVGDSEGDRRAAAEAGVDFVARNSGLAFAEPPRVVVRDLTGLAAHLAHRFA
jgi:phosphoglycolate phosphatase-like HAD superfamily hydrolase